MDIKQPFLAGTLFTGSSVILGALGAHYLKEQVHLSPDHLQTFETGVRYQMYHGLALLLLGILYQKDLSAKLLRTAIYCFETGIIFFSGSIYFLALRDVLPFSVRFLGPVTPLGGLVLIGGWILLFIYFLKQKKV